MTDTRAVWLANLPLVRFTLNRMKADGELVQPINDDLIQQGALALGEALARWQPDRGALSTFIVAAIRGAVLDFMAASRSGGMGRRALALQPLPPDTDAPGDEAEDYQAADGSLHYGRTGYTPDGYEDPAARVERDTVLRQLRFAVDLLNDSDRDLLSCLYGLDGSRQPAEVYAERVGVSRRTINTRKAQALRRLARVMGG